MAVYQQKQYKRRLDLENRMSFELSVRFFIIRVVAYIRLVSPLGSNESLYSKQHKLYTIE